MSWFGSSTRKTTIFYIVLVAMASLVVGMVIWLALVPVVEILRGIDRFESDGRLTNARLRAEHVRIEARAVGGRGGDAFVADRECALCV